MLIVTVVTNFLVANPLDYVVEHFRAIMHAARAAAFN